MNNLISKIRTFFNSNIGHKIGHCATCMRQSLTAALAAWGALGTGLLMWPDNPVQYLIGIFAIGLTGLWMLHVIVHTVRTMAKLQNNDRPAQAAPGLEHIGRRSALGVFTRAALISVAASTPVLLLPSEAFAFCGQCTVNSDCGSTNSGWCCKNTAPVNAGYVCNECKKC